MEATKSLAGSLIPIVSKIREALEVTGASKSVDLGLPQIVVVGSQSAGKSSVLENIVGHTILPRGTGIVTRVPLILSLHCPDATELAASKADPENAENQDEWAEFLHLPGKRFFDFNEVRDMVQSRTDFLAGSDRGVVDAPIHLKVSSPKLLELTLVDLPGITRVPVGDQPSDIEARIRQLCLDYISKEDTVILAITAANTDLANSDSLQLARTVDPSGLRTVGVLTKIDLMDPGTECTEVLLNKVLPLELGYIAVVNRGQRDIQQGVGVRTALENEAEFFKSNPAYGGPACPAALKRCCGTGALVSRLSHHLHGRIASALPGLRRRVAALLQDAADDRKALGEEVPVGEAKRRCLDEITAFSQRLKDELEGNVSALEDASAALGMGDEDEEEEEDGEGLGEDWGGASWSSSLGAVSGVAVLTHLFEHEFGGSLAAIDALDGLSDAYIRRVIDNSNTLPPSLFVPEKAFHALVKEQIARLEQPGLSCVEMAHERLLGIAKRCIRRQLRGCGGGEEGGRFPALARRIEELVAARLAPMAENCKAKVRDMIDFEMEYINTKHPDFIESQGALLPSLLQPPPPPPSAPAPPSVPAASAGGGERFSGDELGVVDVDEDDHPTQHTQRASGNNNNDREGGPWWAGLLGGGSPHKASAQPRPRRGGRRSSFGIMDNDELDAFRQRLNAQSTSGEGGGYAQAAAPGRIGTKLTLSAGETRQDREVEVVGHLIRCYFDIVARDFCDKVPKAIMCTMVSKLKNTIQNELITALYEGCAAAPSQSGAESCVERAEDLMAEPSAVREHRAEVKAREAALLEASHILESSRTLLVANSSAGGAPGRNKSSSRGPLSGAGSSNKPHRGGGGGSFARNPMAKVAGSSSISASSGSNSRGALAQSHKENVLEEAYA